MRGIIIGAGIGGLATAIGLQKQGFAVRIYEAAPALKPIGAGLWVAPNGLNVLRRLEEQLYHEVKAAGRSFDQLQILHSDGQVFSSLDTKNLESKFGTRPVAIQRSELHHCLCEHLEPDSLVTGKRFLRYEESEKGVTAYFEDGSTATGDFLLGADGIRSGVRDQLFGSQELRYSGQTCWRGLGHFGLPAPYTHRATEIWCDTPGVRAGFSHVSANLVYFYLTDSQPAGGKDAAEGLKSFLHERFSEFPRVVHEIIDATESEKFLRNDLYDLPPLRHYTRGKIALLGDSAHATTPNLGQGANQALESALAISSCLSGVKSHAELPAAFSAYERKRHAKATYIVKTSHQIGELSNIRNRLGQKIRNFVMSHMPEVMTERAFERIYSLEE